MVNKQFMASWAYPYLARMAVLAEKLSEQRHIAAIRRGLLLTTPIVVIGSFASMLVNLPLPFYRNFIASLFGQNWFLPGVAMVNATFGIMSLLLTLGISYFLTETSLLAKQNKAHPVIATSVALCCLILLIQPVNQEGTLALPLTWLGLFGLFPALLTALVATEIFLYLSSIKWIRFNVFFDEADPALAQAVAGILPAGGTLVIFCLLKIAASEVGIAELHQFIYDLIKILFENAPNTLPVALAFQFMVQVLWFWGIHGQNALNSISQNLYTMAAEQNHAIYLAGGQSETILTTSFFNSYVVIGGSGSTLCLILAILLVSRTSNTGWLARLSLPFSLFNINELLLFGLPVVFNPIYLIPFILVPQVLTLLAYLVIAIGWVPLPIIHFHWTTPVLFNAYLASHSWVGVGFQFLNIVVGTAIYLPFVMIGEQQKQLHMQKSLVRLTQVALSPAEGAGELVMNRRDSIGNLARVLAHDLKKELDKKKLFLAYQPQVDSYGRVSGVEALLRWNHKRLGPIPPPVTILLAEESGLIHSVGKWVIDQACKELRVWKDQGNINLTMAVNVSASQLYRQEILTEIAQALAQNSLEPQDLEIEITEGIAMENDVRTQAMLVRLSEMGIRIAIDDFGTGYSSLTYIKNFPVDTLKIDRVLSQDVSKDNNCREIVASIIALCDSLMIKTVVEYVETLEQREVLGELGCQHYQGYLYSPALPGNKAYDYIQRQNKI